MHNSRVSKNGYLIVLPWGLEHIGGVNQAVLDLRSQMSLNGRLRPVVLITESGHEKIEIAADSTVFHEYRLTLPQPLIQAHPIKSVISYLLKLPRLLVRLIRVLREEEISTINVHYPSPSEITVILAAKMLSRRTKVILSFHGADVGNLELAKGWHKWFWNRLLARADYIVTCSEALGLRLSAAMRKPRNPITAVHNGVDQGVLKRSAEKGRVPEAILGKRFILNVATLERKKGQDILIRAFARLAPRFPEHLLVIMGRYGESERQLRSMLSELELNDQVLILEDVSHDDVLATMKEAELFVLPSRIEPFGIVLLEAATFGVPVIATRTGGIPEVIEHERSGLLVPIEDVEGLCAALLEILSDRKKASRLADRMSKRVNEEFSIVRVTHQYEAMAGLAFPHNCPER